MKVENPFHPGEIEAQQRSGEAAIAERNSAVISDTIIAGALTFLKQQRMAVFGTIAADGTRWASVLFGQSGFMTPPDARQIRFERKAIERVPADVFWENLQPGAPAGMLAIELATRRRLRVNGVLDEVAPDSFRLSVREAYPNCPKYIQRRTLRFEDGTVADNETVSGAGTALNEAASRLLESADTLFLATGHEERGLDVSHRGGNPGFIELRGSDRIRVPDYNGNSLFNTFGNLLLDPRAGVTVMDFAGGRMLQMTGEGIPLWNQPDESGRTGGTGRYWEFTVQQWRILPIPAVIRWEFQDASPFNPKAS